MTDQSNAGFVRDSSTGALVVLGPNGSTAAPQTLGTLVKTDANFTTTNAANTAVTGLTGLSVTVGTRPIIVELTASGLNNTTAGDFASCDVQMDGTTVVCQGPTIRSINANDEFGVSVRGYLNNLTPGTAHTFQARVGAVFALGTATLVVSASRPAVLTVREL